MNKNEVIVKPITILREEFIENLLNLCNGSGLPFFVLESILKDFTQNIHAASKQQYETDKKKYEQELSKFYSSEKSEKKNSVSGTNT